MRPSDEHQRVFTRPDMMSAAHSPPLVDDNILASMEGGARGNTLSRLNNAWRNLRAVLLVLIVGGVGWLVATNINSAHNDVPLPAEELALNAPPRVVDEPPTPPATALIHDDHAAPPRTSAASEPPVPPMPPAGFAVAPRTSAPATIAPAVAGGAPGPTADNGAIGHAEGNNIVGYAAGTNMIANAAGSSMSAHAAAPAMTPAQASPARTPSQARVVAQASRTPMPAKPGAHNKTPLAAKAAARTAPNMKAHDAAPRLAAHGRAATSAAPRKTQGATMVADAAPTDDDVDLLTALVAHANNEPVGTAPAPAPATGACGNGVDAGKRCRDRPPGRP